MKQSRYWDIENLKELRINSRIYSWGDFQGEVIEGCVKSKSYQTYGNERHPHLNIKAFKLKNNKVDYQIW